MNALTRKERREERRLNLIAFGPNTRAGCRSWHGARACEARRKARAHEAAAEMLRDLAAAYDARYHAMLAVEARAEAHLHSSLAGTYPVRGA